jgi:hypothetical protein
VEELQQAAEDAANYKSKSDQLEDDLTHSKVAIYAFERACTHLSCVFVCVYMRVCVCVCLCVGVCMSTRASLTSWKRTSRTPR